MEWPQAKEGIYYGVGILMASHLKLDAYKEHLAARIISSKLSVKNLRLFMINVYATTDATESESTKNAFYTALNKAKEELHHNPSYKWIALGYFNASISIKSKISGSWDSILCHNNIKINKIETEMLKDYCNGVWKTMWRSPAPYSEQNEYIVKLRSMLRLANGGE